eukprot:2076409-Pyramimonas_sp.AAC.1
MVDPFTVRLFQGTLRRPIFARLDQLKPAAARSRSSRRQTAVVDLALWRFAGDLWKFDAAPHGCQLTDLVKQLALSDSALDAELENI